MPKIKRMPIPLEKYYEIQKSQKSEESPSKPILKPKVKKRLSTNTFKSV